MTSFRDCCAAVEQPDEADERPRFGPTGHGGGALRVLALRRAPDARSLSGVFGGRPKRRRDCERYAIMMGLEVSLNGRRLCVAGQADSHVFLFLTLSDWWLKEGERAPSE